MTEETKAKPGKRGGRREGAGRKKGSTNLISAVELLSTIKAKTGREYVEHLTEDFIQARNSADSSLLVKYHQLILNKVMNTMAHIEVSDSEANIDSKRAAFAEALAKLSGVKED